MAESKKRRRERELAERKEAAFEEVASKMKQVEAASRERLARLPVPMTDEEIRHFMATGK